MVSITLIYINIMKCKKIYLSLLALDALHNIYQQHIFVQHRHVHCKRWPNTKCNRVLIHLVEALYINVQRTV